MIKVELTRFRIKKGREKKAQEWMDFLNQYHSETVATMAGEKMYVETVFKDENPDGYTYFYWYSIQGEGGNPVEESESDLDQKHLAYWEECIDADYVPVNLLLEQSLFAPLVEKTIRQIAN